MRVPISWLGELTALPVDATAESVMHELVKVGLEDEGVHGSVLKGPIVVGEVLSFEPEAQSNGKTIRWCQVRVAKPGAKALDGGGDVRGVVCGASNFAVGDKVVVTLPGAVLPGGFEIAARKTYGHVSDGMIASQRELGMGEDHAGILVLSALGLDPEVGQDAIALLGLGETAAEVNVTPDRGYCFSMRGIAREYAHATHQSFIDPISRIETIAGQGFKLAVEDTAPIRGRVGCNSFYALALEGLNPTAPTPAWMASRLQLAGMRSISIAVDISNYVMLELGQPNHTYDLDKLQGGIVVRRAKAGERLTTLDGKVRELDREDLLITDDSGAIGLAGVMGGASTEVSDSTSRVLIEAAHFDPTSIARSARRHRLISEASKRFERGVDPNLAPYTIARVAQLLHELAGARVIEQSGSPLGGLIHPTLAPFEIELPKAFASELVGFDYSSTDCERVLTEIGCRLNDQGPNWLVTPPSWRPDLRHKTDLVEEIARLIGYDKIPTVIPVAPPGSGFTGKQQLRRRIVAGLANFGLVEVLNYPFASATDIQTFHPGAQPVRLENPMQEESPFLRLSLLPGLVQATARNRSRGQVSIQVFEEGGVFHPHDLQGGASLPSTAARPDDSELARLKAGIPTQPRMVAGVFAGPALPASPGQESRVADFTDAISAVMLVSQQAGVDVQIRSSAAPGWHPGRCADVLVGDIRVGIVGELHPDFVGEFHLSDRIAAFEVNLDTLFGAQPSQILAGELRVMPAATQDISLVLDDSTSAVEVLEQIRILAGDLLESATLIDVYQGPPLASDKKSLTFSLVFRAADRTLTQQEVTEIRDTVVSGLDTSFGAELRS